MPNRRKSSGQRAPPKLFRCSGYGNCDMVFTRSEHLARHERKHTGEKPYKCIVPDCGRMFSRFDNMMQHTQTHEKNKKVSPRSTNKMDTNFSAQGYLAPRPNATQIKTEPMSPIKTEFNCWSGRQGNISDLIMATSFVPPPGQTSMMNSRILPLPTRRASFSTHSSAPYPSSNYRLSHPQDVPSQFYSNDVLTKSYNVPRNRSSWPVRRESYQSSYYAPLPVQQKDFEGYHGDLRRRSSTSTHSSESTLISPAPYQYPRDPNIARRRISVDDLRLPIEHLKNIQLDEKNGYSNNDSNTVDISCAEYEALEGFSKFRSNPTITKETPSPITEETPSPISRNTSPTIAAQVCAMRQRGMTNESFLRR
ncbi:hypothetical protein INT47_002944 [Mucor saturninus]|uniref:C2H2-type domain-containing protein n=1 Tax=Mucor saturninus TaxID=64648 RepID=A0A8H7QQM6_9FUNG|nr:hypothetical protein INT47_002944 [Mucor saturninus]